MGITFDLEGAVDDLLFIYFELQVQDTRTLKQLTRLEVRTVQCRFKIYVAFII